MSKEINAWLENGSNYHEGISIYESLGSDNFLKRLFKKGESALTKQKLSEALGNILLSTEQEIIPEPIPEPTRAYSPAHADPPPPPVSKELPELLRVINEIGRNYGEIRALHAHLSVTEEGEPLRQLACTIQRLGKRNSELMMRRNYLTENGPEDIEVEEPRIPIMIDYNLLEEKERIRKSLSKARSRLRRQEKSSKAKDFTKTLIAEREMEFAAINKRIAEIKAKGGANA
jgi:hypothetical protein